MNLKIIIFTIFITLFTNGCSNDDPGALEGSWQIVSMVPMTAHFRKGESEVMGIIDKVSYSAKGNDIIVTYESGISEGSSVRFTMKDSGHARSLLGPMFRLND